MRNRRFTLRCMVIVAASVIILLLSNPGSLFSPAFAQDADLSQIQNDAHNASFMSGRIERRIREVRTLVYVTLGLTVIGFGVGGYFLLGPRPNQPETRPGAGAAAVTDVLLRWWDGRTLARLGRRQRRLARAIAELQELADLAARRDQEMATLLASVKARMSEINDAIEKPPAHIS